MNLDDKVICTILLSSLKDMEKNYTVSLTEMSQESVYKKLLDDFTSISDMQREVFCKMNDSGFYDLNYVNKSNINKECKSLENMYNGL